VRNVEGLRQGLTRWIRACPDQVPSSSGQLEITAIAHATSGLANETVLLSLSGDHPGLAIRLPPLEPTFPIYDMATQAAVQNAVSGAGIPAPSPAICVTDTQWIDSTFLAMPRVHGRIPGPAPVFDKWIGEQTSEGQRVIHEGLIAMLARLHRIDAATLPLTQLPGPTLEAALEYWTSYVEWASSGQPVPALTEALAWCRAHRPAPSAGDTSAVVWGDPRLGNLVFDDDLNVVAVLDWELAALGPPELDLGWYFGLDSMMDELFGRRVPGFPERGEALAVYEEAAGRAVNDLEWHEIFALVRAVAINDRQQRVAAASGTRYVGGAPSASPQDDPLATFLRSRVRRAS
jgi:aminoglycoside phosphotransferase (APT) family kinase protein